MDFDLQESCQAGAKFLCMPYPIAFNCLSYGSVYGVFTMAHLIRSVKKSLAFIVWRDNSLIHVLRTGILCGQHHLSHLGEQNFPNVSEERSLLLDEENKLAVQLHTQEAEAGELL